MKTLNTPQFDTDSLRCAFQEACQRRFQNINDILILERQENIYSSTFPSEIITVELKGETKFKVLCKYIFQVKRSNYELGHKGNKEYEWMVYRHVLPSLNFSYPELYGVFTDRESNGIILFIQYLDQATHLHKTTAEDTMNKAARWIGEFHRHNLSRVLDKKTSFLINYKASYYSRWVNRTLEYASPSLHRKFIWFKQLCLGFKNNIQEINNIPITVIHGEYYPMNILYKKGKIYPIDWESAAIAFGEIDLVSLIDGWSKPIADRCMNEYRQCLKYPASSMGFEGRLAWARLYWCFRRLGRSQQHANRNRPVKYFQDMKESGELLNLI